MAKLATNQMRPPQQERSRATLERILAATESLLRRRLLEEITLSDILKKARVSVGAFYARFPNKESLIPLLYERYDKRLTEAAARALDSQRWQGRGISERVAALFRFVVTLYRRDQGLMRAITLRSRTHPDTVSGLQREQRIDFYDMVAQLLLERAGEITHPDPDRAVRFGLLMAGATLREKILYVGPHAAATDITDSRLAREMSQAFLKYVGAKGVQE